MRNFVLVFGSFRKKYNIFFKKIIMHDFSKYKGDLSDIEIFELFDTYHNLNNYSKY